MISVIVPIYNSEKYLNQCLTSLVKQTYSDLEIMIERRLENVRL